MSTVTALRSEQDLWRITRIPRFQTEKDAQALRLKCEQLFRIKGDRKIVVVTKGGDIVHIADVDGVINLYRLHGAISMIAFTYSDVKLLTHIRFDAQ